MTTSRTDMTLDELKQQGGAQPTPTGGMTLDAIKSGGQQIPKTPDEGVITNLNRQLSQGDNLHPALKQWYGARVVADVKKGLGESAQNFSDAWKQNTAPTTGKVSYWGGDPLSTGVNVTAPLVKAAAAPLSEGISTLTHASAKGYLGPVVDEGSPENIALKAQVKKGLDAIGKTGGGQAAQGALTSVLDMWHNFATQHPVLVKDAKSILDLATNLPLVASEYNIAGAGIKGIQNMAAERAKTAAASATTPAEAAQTHLDEIMATSEKDVPKLRPEERKVWFDNQHAQIATQSETVNAQIKQELAAKSEASLQEADALNRELATTARDKVIELRPKIIKAMGEQSQTYRDLVDEAMAGNEGTVVHKGNLATFVDQQFGDDPGRAIAIKDKLGLSVPGGEPATTLGDIYDQTKALRQTMSGGKVFTADDKLTDDAVSTLLDYMKKNGVDLKEANQFWSEYAPVRNQLVSEAKPFLQADIQTKRFATTLVNVAKGKDVNNENFIAETENLLGESTTDEVKATLAKLNANEKTALANEMEAAVKQAENDAVKEAALKQLSATELNVMKQVRIRTLVKRVLLAAGGVGIDRIVKKYTGIGI